MPTLPPRHKNTGIPERLFAIAERLPESGTVCDVGSDHGLLPLYLLQRSPALRAVVTDVRDKPLSRAKATLTEGGVDNRAEFVLTDGIASLTGRSIDAFVIAGMSGETIARILSEGQGVLRAGQRFYLQPMSHEDLLRPYLVSAGFSITEELVVRENKKLFLLICAAFTGVKGEEMNPVSAALGDYLPRRPGTWGRAFYEEKQRRISRTAEKKSAAGLCTVREQAILDRIDGILEEMP